MTDPKTNYKTEWNLGLLYSGDTDPNIEKDMKLIEKECASFEKKYKKTNYTSSTSKLLKALQDNERLLEKVYGRKPWWYFALRSKSNGSDQIANASSTKYSERITHALNKVTFFELTIAKIPKAAQGKFLKDTILARYKYMLKKIFKEAESNLPEGEEQIINLLSETSYGMWVDGQEKLLGEQSVLHKGEKISLPQAMGMLPSLPTKERRTLDREIMLAEKSISHFAEAEINAVYNYRKVLDERKGYKKPYSSRVLSDENDEKTVELLVDLVTKNFSISKRFFKLHAKLLKEEKLVYADRIAEVGNIRKKFDFDTSVTLVRNVLNTIDAKYGSILDRFLKKGQIDVYPRLNKYGGAFCWPAVGLPTFVLLNHTDDINSVQTLAHEMGHAIHTELSKNQPAQYESYSMAVAEVASTFFEQALGDELQNHLSKEEQIIFFHNKIKGDIQTIFRQVACFNFELELHNKIRKKGQVGKEEIAGLLSKHMKSYLGDIFEVTEDDGYSFVGWSHIRSFFYVYSYAYGQLVSRALFVKWKEDKSYAQKIEQFLSSGGSMSPRDIFKKIGIDTSDPSFFEAGLKSIEKDIKKLEELTK